jgi:sugar phosphate isomerase/epimerase
MIEFSCHTWAFNDLTLPEALGTIARMGFRYVDIGSGPNLNAPRAATNPRKVAVEIADDLETFNLKLSDIYLMLPRISVADEEARRKELELYKSLIPFVKALNAPGITLSPGLAQAAEDTEANDRAGDALREMVRSGKEVGLRISIEPHLDSLAHTPEQALKLVKDVPGLEITLDWAHMICQDISHADILTLLPHTRHVQLRQAAKRQLQTPFEKGRIDVKQVVDALKNANYEGVICVEYMNMTGWHGMAAVDAVTESARMRDALRNVR